MAAFLNSLSCLCGLQFDSGLLPNDFLSKFKKKEVKKKTRMSVVLYKLIKSTKRSLTISSLTCMVLSRIVLPGISSL